MFLGTPTWIRTGRDPRCRSKADYGFTAGVRLALRLWPVGRHGVPFQFDLAVHCVSPNRLVVVTSITPGRKNNQGQFFIDLTENRIKLT